MTSNTIGEIGVNLRPDSFSLRQYILWKQAIFSLNFCYNFRLSGRNSVVECLLPKQIPDG